MDFTQLVNKLNSYRDGVFISIVYSGDLPLNAASKKAGMTATKVSEMVIRKGIDYDHQKSVQEKVANGKVLTHELPWGNWKAGFEGLVIEHKGTDYIRLYPSNHQIKTKYYINNIEQSYEDLQKSNCLVNSFFNKNTSDKPDCMTIKVDNILSIK